MDALEKLNVSLKAEADILLHEHGLLKILEKYGDPFITGSCALGLMLRRDLDVNLGTDNMTEATFFQMGGEIATALKPARITYQNEFVLRHPRLPMGFYFGVSMGKIPDAETWNIDIWAMDTQQLNKYKQELSSLKSAIDTQRRTLILEIKSKSLANPEYQHKFFSYDVYRAVIDKNVKSADEFFEWVKENRVTDHTI